MDIFSTARVFRRRWYVIAPVMLLALVAELFVPRTIPVSYRSSASVLLVAPAGGSNPYLNFNQSLITVAGIVARSVSLPDSSRRLSQEGAKGSFAVSPPQVEWNPGPLIGISAEDNDPQVARGTADLVLSEVRRTLLAQQREAGAPASSLIQAVVVSQSAEPVAVYGNRRQAAIAILALAFALATGGAFLTEAIAVRRARGAEMLVGHPAFEGRALRLGEPAVHRGWEHIP
ncbi:MAG: hypothetical protein WCD35_07640 [Mycobacteriales bacterium]